MNLQRSRIVHLSHSEPAQCGVCGWEGWLPAMDITMDRHLCGACIEPALQAERELMWAGREHPPRSLTIQNP